MSEEKKLPGWIGAYKIREIIGSGATGHVYLAEDPSLNRKVAVKILKSKFKYDNELRQRFLREAQAMAKLSHPAVVSVYTVGDEEGVPYLVMEYMKELDLLSVIDTSKMGRLPVSKALPIFIDVCQGLETALENNIIHRDIKPANIFLAGKNRAKIGDFGLASVLELESNLTADGVIIGTPDYIAPEIISGEKPNMHSDIYSLGCSLFHALKGYPPYREKNEDISSGEVLGRQLNSDPPPLKGKDFSRSLTKIVAQMLNKNPDKRPNYPTIIKRLKKSLDSDTITINIPRLSSISHKNSDKTESGNDDTENSNDILPFPAAFLVLFGLFFSTLILFLGIYLLN